MGRRVGGVGGWGYYINNSSEQQRALTEIDAYVTSYEKKPPPRYLDLVEAHEVIHVKIWKSF